MHSIKVVLVAVLLGACTQLSPTTIGMNIPPPFEASSLVSSKNGIVAVDLARLPGAVCIPDGEGKCTSDNFLPSPVRTANSTVTITPTTDITPKYRSLIDNKYAATATVPFLSGSLNVEQYNEVTASILATATFGQNSPGDGYPGIGAIRTALAQAGHQTTQGHVYWLSSANVIGVLTNKFRKVNSAANVTVTGVGINGSTYNGTEQEMQQIWIGIFAHRIELAGGPPVPIALQAPADLGGKQLKNLPPIASNAPIMSVPSVK
jgi:hypothetical protein